MSSRAAGSTPEEQTPEDQTPEGWTPVPTPPERKRSYAVLIAGGIAVLAVLAVLVFSWLKPTPALTVADLRTPAVAALGGGSALYPANSKEALAEDVKFGYLPAIDLARTADGTLVLADPEAEPAALGLRSPITRTDDATFAEAAIPPAPEQDRTGTTLTWQQALDDFGAATVLMPALTAETAADAIAAVEDAQRTDGVIIRSADPAVLAQAAQAGITGLFTGAAAPGKVDAPMVQVPADSPELPAYLDAAPEVWVTGVRSEKELTELAGRGVYGALADNPFAIQPSAVKTD